MYEEAQARVYRTNCCLALQDTKSNKRKMATERVYESGRTFAIVVGQLLPPVLTTGGASLASHSNLQRCLLGSGGGGSFVGLQDRRFSQREGTSAQCQV